MSNNKNVLFLREEYGNGQGTYIYPNGEKYVGNWKNGKYHGHETNSQTKRFPSKRYFSKIFGLEEKVDKKQK